MAMPPPMVPAPITAHLVHRDRRRVLRDAWNFGNFALGEEHVDQSLGLVGEQTFLEQFGLALGCLRRRAAGWRFHRIDGGQRCDQLRCVFAAYSRASGEDGGVGSSSPSLSFRSRVRREAFRPFRARTPARLPADRLRQSGRRCRTPERRPCADRVADRAHLHRLRDSGQPRQPLCPPGAGNDAELDFRLAHLRRRHGDAIVARHGGFEARRRAPCRESRLRPASSSLDAIEDAELNPGPGGGRLLDVILPNHECRRPR